MPPLIAALTAGRTTRPTAGSTVGARRSAPTPTARPVTVLPLNTSSKIAIWVPLQWVAGADSNNASAVDKRWVEWTIRRDGNFSVIGGRCAPRGRATGPFIG